MEEPVMSVRASVETAIRSLVDEFVREPYVFFTEADAVARFHQLLAGDSVCDRRVRTKDDRGISLVHREYPTFFRFNDRNPAERLGSESRARRGHYDTVILTPEFVAAHPVETVLNRSVEAVRDPGITPFEAVVEFKLHTRGWSKGRAQGVIAEVGKLHLSAPETPLRYLVLLMRYREHGMQRWNRYWPRVCSAAEAEENGIGSVFAIHWIGLDRKPEIHRFGPWLPETWEGYGQGQT